MSQTLLAPFRQQITLFASIEAAAATIRQRYDWWPCGRGCHECCQHAFPIAENEWRLAQLALLQLDDERQQTIRRKARAQVRQMRGAGGRSVNWRDARTQQRLGVDLTLPCPMLDEEGACQIYEARPAVCRMFGYGGFRYSERPGQSAQSYLCSIIGRELDRRRQAGQEVELADLTEQRQALGRLELGRRQSIAEWLIED